MVRLINPVCGPALAGRLKPALTLIILIASAASAHQLADVRISFDVPSFVPVQQAFRYRVIADDLNNDEGAGIVVTIVLPQQVRFSSAPNSTPWTCTESQLTVTCSADEIVPGPNPIEIDVIAPAQTSALHATASVQSLESLDPNPGNDNALSDIVAFDPSSCTAAPPMLLAPGDGSSQPPVVPVAWSAVPGANHYTIFTSVEGAAAAPSLTTVAEIASLIAEPGRSEWWVVASFASCPPVSSSHRHFTALATLPRSVTTFAGDPKIDATRDGPRSSATFRRPFGLALSPSNDLYVSDEADSVVRRIANDAVTTIAGAAGQPGSADGQFARFQNPRGLAVTPLDGYVFAADTLNDEVRILYTGGPFVPAYNVGGGVGVSGLVDDVSDKARFDEPSGVAATERGNLYVVDTHNNSIRKMTQVPEFIGLFTVSTIASGLHAPLGVAVDSNEAVYVADTDDDAIRKIDSGVVTVIARNLDHPTGIALDTRGNVFVTDRIGVHRIAPSGLLTTIATGFTAPAGIVVDPSGRIFVADEGAHVVVAIDLPVARRHAVH